jgi:hypothetical protein
VLPPLLKPQLKDATPAAQHNSDVRKPERALDVETVDIGSPLGGVFGEGFYYLSPEPPTRALA